MPDELFAVLLDLMMVSDPWPLKAEDHALLTKELDKEARARGYSDWVEALHRVRPKLKT